MVERNQNGGSVVGVAKKSGSFGGGDDNLKLEVNKA